MSTEENKTYGTCSTTDAKKLVPLMRKVQRAIDNKKFFERHLTLASMSHDLATNRTYLSDLIHQQYGMSFSDFVNHLRIEEAKKVLSDTDNEKTIRELYLSLGYNSSTSFYRNFKRIVGMSATEYMMKMHE